VALVHAQLGFLGEALCTAQTSFANHQRATKAQRHYHYSRRSLGNSQDRNDRREDSLAVITGNGSTNGDQSGGGKQSQTRLEKAQRPEQQIQCAIAMPVTAATRLAVRNLGLHDLSASERSQE
jgi:hypothetical protein